MTAVSAGGYGDGGRVGVVQMIAVSGGVYGEGGITAPEIVFG